MKRGIVLGIALLATIVSLAQHRQENPQARAAHQTEKMKTLLSLNDTQYAAVKKINDEYATRLLTFRKEQKPHDSDKREAFKKLREEKDNELAAVLTPEQQSKWRSFREERKANKKAKKETWKEKKREELKTTLSLTDEQVLKLDQERESFMENRMSIRNDPGLSDADRKQKSDALKREHESTMKKILTPVQYEKLKNMRADRRDHKHKKRR